jgi:hypothetical protein
MIDILKTLQNTPLPTIFVIGGSIFILLSFIGKIGDEIEIDVKQKGIVLFVGLILLVIGIGTYLIPTQKTTTLQTPATPDIITTIVGVMIGIVGTLAGFLQFKQTLDNSRLSVKRIAQAESRVEAQPEKIKPAWDLARVTLESYFNRNLSQVTAIFWLSVTVMFIGFAIIIWGIAQAIQSPSSTLPAVITGMAGIVTELIGATFLFIYRSTMEQAVTYTKTLERINSVGMAMQILDTIPNNAKDDGLKNSTKATVVKMLMQQAFDIETAQNTVQEKS